MTNHLVAVKPFPDFELNRDQANAVDAILQWREQWPDAKQTFVLGGLAGTGKTTIQAWLMSRLPNPVFAAPTGKAVQRLRENGVGASTIHNLIYIPMNDGNGRVRFKRRRTIDAETICIDEASMVDEEMHRDLLSFSKPILYVGDHGQLEPIGRNPNLMKNPNVSLEVIHRQAEGNPILRLAAAFRGGRRVPRDWRDNEGRCIITRKSAFVQYQDAGLQVIVGFNKTRHLLNARIREHRGFRGDPCPGERLVCLRNNRRYGLFNGQLTTCKRSETRHRTIDLELELDDGATIWVPALREQFGQNTLAEHRDQGVLLMDYAYALTAHKAQGSEYDGVVVLEEIFPKWDARRWRYTATTRAMNRLVYCV